MHLSDKDHLVKHATLSLLGLVLKPFLSFPEPEPVPELHLSEGFLSFPIKESAPLNLSSLSFALVYHSQDVTLFVGVFFGVWSQGAVKFQKVALKFFLTALIEVKCARLCTLFLDLGENFLALTVGALIH